jgi:hypothetical protein
MQINIQKFNEVAEAAKAKTNDKRWHNAIQRAVDGVASGQWVITELQNSIAVTTDSGETHFVNGHCTCRAAQLGQPCKHLALRRLIELYNETAPVAVSRASLIADIKATWSKTWPPLAVELMARFRVNLLEMLDADMLRRVSLAIAM